MKARNARLAPVSGLVRRPIHKRLVAVVAAVALTASLAAAAVTNGPVKVFLLSGQSNMTGRGKLGHTDRAGKLLPLEQQQAMLIEFISRPGNTDTYRLLRDGTNKTDAGWTIRDDVFITTGDWPHPQPGEADYDAKRKHGGLAPGYGGRRGRGFGPELAIGHLLGNHYAEPVLLVKVAFGGNSLARNFRPPSSGGKTGDKYPKILQAYHDAIAHLPEIIPGYDPQQGYELVGFFWNQGLSDMNPSHSQEYERNLVNLIKDLRRDLNAPDLKTVVAITGNWGRGTEHYRAHLAEYAQNKDIPVEQFMDDRGRAFIESLDAIQRAQLAVAERPAFKGTVATAETRDFWRARKEYGGRGTWQHWNANAESYWLIGASMADAMLGLGKHGPKADALVADIQAATHTRELITMQAAIEAGSQPAPRVPGEGLSPMQITHQVQASLERVRNACVAVRWRASGVIISPDGYILTAGHVAASAMKSKKPIRVHLADGRRADVTFVGWDKSSDLALLKITDETVAWPYVPLADRVPDGPAIVFHYAHTGGYQKDRPAQLRIGRIRTRSMAGDQTRFILSDISVQPGDSGGPLFDIDGRLIGFCTSAGPIGVNQFSAIDNFHAGREDLMAGKRWGDPADAALGTTPQTIDRAARQRIMAEFKRRIKDQYAPVMDMVLEKAAGGARAEIGFDAIMQNMGVDGVMIVQEGALAYGLDDPALVRQLGKLPAGSVLPLVIAADGQPISYGLPVTATHVVAKQSEIDNDADLTLRVPAGNTVALVPVASDPTWDLVLLQVAADHKLTPLQWPQEPVEIKAGTGVMSPDTKGRLCWGVASDQRRPITKPGAVGPMLDTARVSAYRAPYPSIIRHHLPLYAADAGRPVYTLDGRFVGLHMGRISRTLGLILDSQDIRRSVDRMLADQAKALVRSNDN